MSRYAHLVGTLPYDDEEAAMSRALDIFGDQLRTLPDGEVGRKSDRHKKGERLGWVQWVIERFEDSPAFEMTKQPRFESRLGLWADYESGVRYKLKVKPRELPEHLDFGFYEYFVPSYATFRRLREERDLPDLKFQVGIPGALALALFTFGPLKGMRLRQAFENRLAIECNQIIDAAGDDVVFQVEIPVELGLYLKAPRLLKPVMLGRAARWSAGLAAKLHAGTRVGVHLCFGDLNNRPFTKVDSVAPLVTFTNAMINAWPQDRPLDFLHMPLAMANIAPPLDETFYAALAALRLPEGTRFGAGFVHEGRAPEEHDRIRAIVEKLLGTEVDISSACGFGRRPTAAAESLMKETARLCAG